MFIDDNIVCPIDEAPLQAVGDGLVSQSGREYGISDGILLLYADEAHLPLATTNSIGIGDTVTHKGSGFLRGRTLSQL